VDPDNPGSRNSFHTGGIVKVEFTHGINCIVTREDSDRRMPSESAFWYALKNKLNAEGFDLVKKVMSKDGHMMGGDNYPYYLRDRAGAFCIFDDAYVVRHLHLDYNRERRVVLVWHTLNS
jgi:hypothetical protein